MALGWMALKLSVQENALTRFRQDGEVLDRGFTLLSIGEIIELRSPPITPWANFRTRRSGIISPKYCYLFALTTPLDPEGMYKFPQVQPAASNIKTLPSSSV